MAIQSSLKANTKGLSTTKMSRTKELIEKYKAKKPNTKNPKLEARSYMAKGGEIAFKNSNLYLNGFGVDSNGNAVIKVSFPNQRAFSIQTNGVLKETHNKSTKKIKDLSDADLKIIEKEVVDYVKDFGSKEQKSKLNSYKAGGYMAKGGNVVGKAGSTYKLEMWDSFDDMQYEKKKPSKIIYSENEKELIDLSEKHQEEKDGSTKLYMKRKGKYMNIATYLKDGGKISDKTKIEVGDEVISLIKNRKEKTGYPVYVITQGYAPMTLDVFKTKELANKTAKKLANYQGYKMEDGGETEFDDEQMVTRGFYEDEPYEYAKGGKTEEFTSIFEDNLITEKEINLIKNRINNNKDDQKTKDVVNYIWDNNPQLTSEQNEKGLKFLINLWKSPTGKERSSNPFGYREQEALETFKYFELAGFHDIARYGQRSFYVPLYNVIGNDTSFQYYYDGKMNIVGEKGMLLAKGSALKNSSELEYDSILSVLKEKIEDAVNEVPNYYENSYNFTGEEVEHNSRDGFIAYTDGGYEAQWFENISSLQGSGYGLPTAGLDAEMQRQVDYNYEYAKDRFKDDYPEIVEELGEENIDYNSLQDAGYDGEAEQLSEWEMNYDGDDTILMQIGSFYYTPENYRGKDSKNTMFVFGNVNLESPYHRSGNLEDGIDSTFTFDSIEELKEKMDESLKKIIDWFNGNYYKEGKKDLKVTRMAKGGKTQGYDDREDERLAMKYGKIKSKYLNSTKARRDDARFEERTMIDGKEFRVITKDRFNKDGINEPYLTYEPIEKKADGGMMAEGGRAKAEQNVLNKRIGEYYLDTFETDDLGFKINSKATFGGLLRVLDNGGNVYEYIGVGDSIIRERVFGKLAKLMNVDYDVIYDKWLFGNKMANGGMMADGGETPFRERINLGKIDYNGKGRKANAVDIEINVKEKQGAKDWETLKEVDGLELSMMGTIWNTRHSDSISGGQNLDELKKYYRGDKDVQKVVSIWEKYHLNDMKAGTKAQTEAIEKWKSQGNRYDYNSAVEHLKEIGLYDDNGYKYGHGWLYQPIPKSVIFELKEAIENIKAKKYKFGGYMADGGEVEPYSKTGKGEFISTEERLNMCSNKLFNKNYNDCNKEQKDKAFDLYLKKYAISYSSKRKMVYGGYMEEGGKIKNQYNGKEPMEVWSQWSINQRLHFLVDHKNHAYKYGNFYSSLVEKDELAMKDYKELPKDLRLAISDHVEGGQYARGGEVNEDNMEMVISQIKAIKHHAEEVSDIINRSTPIEAWVVAKIERAETDLSDVTHYLDGIKN
jgi:hypothetical protein